MVVMYLVILNARVSDAPVRLLSVWVKAPDEATAEVRVRELARSENWTITSVDSVNETGTDDYFRVCPSQQAYLRAEREGIAWRLNDAPAVETTAACPLIEDPESEEGSRGPS